MGTVYVATTKSNTLSKQSFMELVNKNNFQCNLRVEGASDDCFPVCFGTSWGWVIFYKDRFCGFEIYGSNIVDPIRDFFRGIGIDVVNEHDYQHPDYHTLFDFDNEC